MQVGCSDFRKGAGDGSNGPQRTSDRPPRHPANQPDQNRETEREQGLDLLDRVVGPLQALSGIHGDAARGGVGIDGDNAHRFGVAERDDGYVMFSLAARHE